jgi:hypothetical protein
MDGDTEDIGDTDCLQPRQHMFDYGLGHAIFLQSFVLTFAKADPLAPG